MINILRNIYINKLNNKNNWFILFYWRSEQKFAYHSISLLNRKHIQLEMTEKYCVDGMKESAAFCRSKLSIKQDRKCKCLKWETHISDDEL